MKIAFFEVTNKKEQEYFIKSLSDHKLSFFKKPLTEKFLPKKNDFEILSIFVNSKINAKVIRYFPKLKYIFVRATGFDSIDLNTANKKDITVFNVPSYGSRTVAEFTIGLILSLSRKIPHAFSNMRFNAKFNNDELRGFDLNEKTLGVIGTGRIGANVIKIAKEFNMKILANDVFPNLELSKTLNFPYLPLEELLPSSDIVTLHVPLMKETYHLINMKNIFLMKKGGFLVNTSRGGVLETKALVEAIKQNHLAGAALDVFEEESQLKTKQFFKKHPLAKLPQVIITPHMAFFSAEAEQSIWQTTIENILTALTGKFQNIAKPLF
ncbi:MAG: NAD(P)-dependent oxidoreductase [Candidatus Daviesbacteria bacterium]